NPRPRAPDQRAATRLAGGRPGQLRQRRGLSPFARSARGRPGVADVADTTSVFPARVAWPTRSRGNGSAPHDGRERAASVARRLPHGGDRAGVAAAALQAGESDRAATGGDGARTPPARDRGGGGPSVFSPRRVLRRGGRAGAGAPAARRI